jgi:hypothetical protein
MEKAVSVRWQHYFGTKTNYIMFLASLKQFVIHFEAKYTDFAIHIYTEVVKILGYRRLAGCVLLLFGSTNNSAIICYSYIIEPFR